MTLVERWGKENGISDSNLDRLVTLAGQIRQKNIKYSASKIKRTLDGALPNTVRWYPPKARAVYIYYETGLDIPRNENEGKEVGWGSMQQWREPSSHLITPKLIYTTASKVKYGLKAFVVDDDWYVKIHGGTSQQYHYTGISNPARTTRMDGQPNNITADGLELVSMLVEGGLDPAYLNFYVAALYNSDVAIEFLEAAGSGTSFSVKIPRQRLERKRMLTLSTTGRTIRDLIWLKNLAEGEEQLDAEGA